MPDATIFLPWRPSASRLPAFELVVAWYREHLPEFALETVDTDDELFSLARCRNEAVARLDETGVAIIGDADTIPEAHAVRQAVIDAASSGRVHLPYTEYRWLGARGTREFARGRALDRCHHELVQGACSGVYVTTRETWLAHGGQDERFRGWGFEDAAWRLAHTTLLGAEPVRHTARVWALHHEPAPRSGEPYEANAALMERYRAASGELEAMRALVADGSVVSAR